MFFGRRYVAPLDYWRVFWLRSLFFLTLLFLYAPIFVLVVFGFNDSRRNIVWRGFTWEYYRKAFSNSALMEAFLNSLTIAFFTTLVSIVLGTLAAVFLRQSRFFGRSVCETALTLPIVLPEICMGIGLMVFFSGIGWPSGLAWPLNLSAIASAHISFCFPVVAIIVRARLRSLRPDLVEAARDLGAGELQVFRDVLLPHIRPALISGALLSFTLSLDDFVVTFFTSGPGTVTLPVKIYSMIRFSVTPEINAASTILLVLTLFFTLLALWVHGSGTEARRGGASL